MFSLPVLVRSLVAALTILAAACGPVLGGETIQYPTSDGFRITADYYRPEAPSARAILLLPDPKEGRAAWSAVADSLARRGFHILVADLRGTGESLFQNGIRRDRSRFAASEGVAAGLDAEAALRYLRDLRATSIRAVALIGSGDGTDAVLRASRMWVDRTARVALSPLPGGADIRSVEWKDPFLLIVGNKDVLGIEVSASVDWSRSGAECWLIDGIGRGIDLMRVRPDLVESLARWVDGALGRF